jgi:alpha-glucoside transport system substrate-binding protein
MLNFVPPKAQIGTDIDFFVLPPVDPSQPTPVTGGAAFASALVDRPEVRAFMEFVASPEWGTHWASDSFGAFISPNRRFDLSNYGDASLDPAVAVRTEMAKVAISALQSDAFRFDASDVLMPAAIGGGTANGAPGAFWRAMVDWVDGTRSIEKGFADIDAEWAKMRSDALADPAARPASP